MIYLNSQKLSEIMRVILSEKGLNNDSIQHVVSSLIQTSLRGIDSHGINIFPHYCNAIDSGRISKNPNIDISNTGASTAVVDADHGIGHHSGAVAMEQAILLAKQTGIAAVNVKNSTHFGAAAYFGFMAADADYIGVAFTNADALLKSFRSKEAFFGTNPICFTAPLRDEHHFCLDMATSIVSWNKIMNKQRNKNAIPENWAFDKNGKMITDPQEAKTLNPVGDYKGYGLAMMIDILCGILANSLTSKDIIPMYTSPIDEKRYISHFFMALDISNFIDITTFKDKLQDVVDRLRKTTPTNTTEPVLVPGDPEKKHFQIRIKEGIPMDELKYQEFLTISSIFADAKM